MTGPMLFIVTDRAEKAVRGLLGLSLESAPAWLSVVSAPDALRQIPNDAPVMSLWFTDGSLVEALWREERVRKGRVFDLDYGRHADRIADWLNRAAAREAALIAEYCAERGEAVPAAISLPGSANDACRVSQETAPVAGRPAEPANSLPTEGCGYARTEGNATQSGVTGGESAAFQSPPQKRAARWS